MYKVVERDTSAETINGSEFTPLVTLADEYGGRAQIAMDDHCYVLYIRTGGKNISVPKTNKDYRKTPWIFREAAEALAGLVLHGTETPA